ncbi:MAG TPA: EamA family transporter [Candidatus Thermoplasmatota archaeon]|nr:EamA family transporter [Candidatus Thermoplasmatota archaeon]
MPLSRGALLAAGSALAYGALGPLAKLAYAEGWGVPSLLVARFGVAALCVLPFALRRRASPRGLAAGFLVGAVGYAGTTALYFPSLRALPAAVASFLLYLAPVLVAALSWLLLRERITPRVGLALGVALAGLAVIAAGAWGGALSPEGVALAAGSAVVFALTVIASRRAVRGEPWAPVTLMVCLGACSTYVVAASVTGRLEAPLSAPGIVYALLIGALATGLALSLFFLAIDRIGASRTAIVSTLEPASTLVFAVVLLGEWPGAAGVAGGALIAAGALLVALGGDPEPPPPA